jgi:hypothetical protein
VRGDASRARDAQAGCRGADGELLRHFVVRELVDHAQHDGAAFVVRQVVERVHECAPRRQAFLDAFVAVFAREVGRQPELLARASLDAVTTSRLAQYVDRDAK